MSECGQRQQETSVAADRLVRSRDSRLSIGWVAAVAMTALCACGDGDADADYDDGGPIVPTPTETPTGTPTGAGASGGSGPGGSTAQGGAGAATAGQWVVDSTFANTVFQRTVSDFSLLYHRGTMRVIYKLTGASAQPLYYTKQNPDGQWSASELDDAIVGRPAFCSGPPLSLWIAYCTNPNIGGLRYGNILGIDGSSSWFDHFDEHYAVNCGDPSVSAGPTPGELFVAVSNSWQNHRAVVRTSVDYAENWTTLGPHLSTYAAHNVVSQTKQNGNTMVAFFEDPDDNGPQNGRLHVYERVNGQWEAVGPSQPVENHIHDFALDESDTPYIAYSHLTYGAVVARFTGSTWELLGDPLDDAWSLDFALAFADGSVPYVAMVTPYEIGKVFRYDEASGWEALGADDRFSTHVEELDMVIGPWDAPYVAFTKSFYPEEPLIIRYEE